MELNGLANMRTIIDVMRKHNEIKEPHYKALSDQIDLMERYLLAIWDDPTVNWHNILMSPENYPNMCQYQQLRRG